MTVHPLRELFALEAEFGAVTIRDRISTDPEAAWARALRVYCQLLEARAYALRNTSDPVEVPGPEEETLFVFADGRIERLTDA